VVVLLIRGFFWALVIIFRLEGGWTDIDGGTKYGIKASTLRSANQTGIVRHNNIRKLTRREAAWIYYKFYWLRSGAYNYSYPLDLIVFDAAVHVGPQKAKNMLNVAIKKTKSKNTKQIARQLLLERYRHLRSLKKYKKYRFGWRRRLHVLNGYVNRGK
jgi:lysozyme family protein